MDYTGITLRFPLDTMRGRGGAAKGSRTAVCIGKHARGWVFIPTTSSWKADWQTDIRQTGEGWVDWDLRYRKPVTWTPNMVMFLSDEEVQGRMAADDRIGWAPQDVVDHGLEEYRYAVRNGLMSRRAWFAQKGLGKR